MKGYLLVLIIIFAIFYGCKNEMELAPDFYQCHATMDDSSLNNPNNAKYQQLLTNITHSGVPGIMMCIHNKLEGTWVGASGKSDLHNNIDMQPCNISRMGSTVKTFTAVSILKLKEEGKLNLDDKITKYLSSDNIHDIENADKATIRQLLQHSSGIFNYIQNMQFQTASLNNLIKVWTPDELLNYARHKKAVFDVGNDVLYSNTNYILLGLIIEKITGTPFYEFFQEMIFNPLNMTKTSFAAQNHVPDGIVRGYVDFYSNLNLINATYYSGWDYYTADGGLISNPYDLSLFMRALFNGQIISSTTLSEMTDWKKPKDKDPDNFDIFYGLGIFKLVTPYGDAYYHSGDAIGYYANMMYFPTQQTTIVWAVNGNYGKIDQLTSSKKAMTQIFDQIFN